MKIVETTFDKIKKYRADYLHSLSEFQELFLEMMICDSDFYLLQTDNANTGYAIKNKDGVLIEFYVVSKYVSSSVEFFRQILNKLRITKIYCKSFDFLLLGDCLLNSFSYKVIGMLYRDYVEPLVETDARLTMQKSDLSSVEFLLNQDHSIKNGMRPSCGCAMENIASQKTLEKSGFVPKYQLIEFTTENNTK